MRERGAGCRADNAGPNPAPGDEGSSMEAATTEELSARRRAISI